MIRGRPSNSSFLILLGLGLVGFGSRTAVAQMEPQPAPQAAPEVALPFGAACTSAIERWRGVVENDYRTGYVDPSVYASAEKDIAGEQSVCAAGRDAEAVRMVTESRRRHGYPLN